jgi:hypothetical protein
VIDPQNQAILQDVVRRETRSLLSYIGDAYPWTTSAGGAALGRLRQVVREDQEAVTALGRYVVRQRVPMPLLGSFPSHFTSYNFVGLGFLLPRLLEDQKSLTALLETDLKRVGHAEGSAALEALLLVKRRHLAELGELAAPQPAPATPAAS